MTTPCFLFSSASGRQTLTGHGNNVSCFCDSSCDPCLATRPTALGAESRIRLRDDEPRGACGKILTADRSVADLTLQARFADFCLWDRPVIFSTLGLWNEQGRRDQNATTQITPPVGVDHDPDLLLRDVFTLQAPLGLPSQAQPVAADMQLRLAA